MNNRQLIRAFENMVPCSEKQAQEHAADVRARQLGYQVNKPCSAELLGMFQEFLPNKEVEKTTYDEEYGLHSDPRRCNGKVLEVKSRTIWIKINPNEKNRFGC